MEALTLPNITLLGRHLHIINCSPLHTRHSSPMPPLHQVPFPHLNSNPSQRETLQANQGAVSCRMFLHLSPLALTSFPRDQQLFLQNSLSFQALVSHHREWVMQLMREVLQSLTPWCLKRTGRSLLVRSLNTPTETKTKVDQCVYFWRKINMHIPSVQCQLCY